jgi:hypothetical protein
VEGKRDELAEKLAKTENFADAREIELMKERQSWQACRSCIGRQQMK